MFDAQVAYMMDMMVNDPESIARLLSTQIWLNVIFGVSLVILVISNLNRRGRSRIKEAIGQLPEGEPSQ